MVGRACLSSEIELIDIIYVPKLTCNLISICQLISMINCQNTFTYALCVIQDYTLKMLIRTGELRGVGVGGLLLQAYSVILGDKGTCRFVFDLAQVLGTSE